MQYINNIGAIATKLKFLKESYIKPSIISQIREKWITIVGEKYVTYLSPVKYTFNARSLIVGTTIPPIYIMHMQDQIKEQAQSVVGVGYIDSVRFSLLEKQLYL